jgi:hypothetical protein
VLICDEAAAGELESGTVNYFKALERTAREKAARELAGRPCPS